MEENNKKSFEDILKELNSILENIPYINKDSKNEIPPLKEDISDVSNDNNLNKENNENKKDIVNDDKDVSGEQSLEELKDENKTELPKKDENKNEEEILTDKLLEETKSNNDQMALNIISLDEELNIIDENIKKTEDEMGKEKEDKIISNETLSENIKEVSLDKEISKDPQDQKSIDDLSSINIDINGDIFLEQPVSNLEKDNELSVDTTIELENKENQNIEIDMDFVEKEKNLEIEKFPSFEIDKNIDSKVDVKEDDITLDKDNLELRNLIEKDPPKDIPLDRIKNVGFVYFSEKDTFIDLLKMIDEITLGSNEKPMFVNRSFVINFNEDLNGDVIILNAKNENVVGVVFIGQIPPDKKYEFENSLSQEGIYFVNFNKSNINRSSVIDFIMELIIR